MPLPANLAAMSQNPALNGPDGSTDGPPILDDGLRLAYSCLAQLRDGVGFSGGALTTSLGYTPVRQYLAGTISIGWSSGSSKLSAKVDATDFGVNWPINITGTAAQLGGRNPVQYAWALGVENMAFAWDGVLGAVIPYVDGNVQYAFTEWSRVQNRPTNLSQFTNGPGYVTAANTIAKIGAVSGIGNVGGSSLTAQIDGIGAVAWGVTPSDQRLKLDIEDTRSDSLAKVMRIRFVGFRFIEGIDDGGRHDVGVIAQELEEIDPRWVLNAGTWKQPDTQQLLIAALHSIKQLEARLAAVEAR